MHVKFKEDIRLRFKIFPLLFFFYLIVFSSFPPDQRHLNWTLSHLRISNYNSGHTGDSLYYSVAPQLRSVEHYYLTIRLTRPPLFLPARLLVLPHCKSGGYNQAQSPSLVNHPLLVPLIISSCRCSNLDDKRRKRKREWGGTPTIIYE